MKPDTLDGLNEARQVVGRRLVRIFGLDRSAIDEENRTVRIAFSSELPVERYFGYEVLDHDPKNVDLTRVPGGMAFLLQHDPDKHIGVIEEVSIDEDRVGRATVRLSRNAEDVWTDIKDGIRRNISVGYEILEVLSETKTDDEKPVVRFAWSPIEISLVAVPADYTVGVGRSFDSEPVPPEGESSRGSEQVPPEGELQAAPDPTPERSEDPTPAPEPEADQVAEQPEPERVPETDPEQRVEDTPRKTEVFFGVHFPDFFRGQ